MEKTKWVWDRENRKTIAFRLNKKKDADLIEKFKRIPNKAEWFKECIRKAKF